MALRITYKKKGDLIPYAMNCRTHSEEQITQIASSIKEFGFTNPVLIDEDDGIIAGHGRIMAAKKLGMDEVPTITITGLTEAQKKAYVIADNKLALNAGWDEETLALEISALQEMDFDLELTGFSADEIDEIEYVPVDIEEVDNFNETFNFSISCKDLGELALVQQALGVTSKKITADKILEVLSGRE